jgi:hypothetical protein
LAFIRSRLRVQPLQPTPRLPPSSCPPGAANRAWNTVMPPWRGRRFFPDRPEIAESWSKAGSLELCGLPRQRVRDFLGSAERDAKAASAAATAAGGSPRPPVTAIRRTTRRPLVAFALLPLPRGSRSRGSPFRLASCTATAAPRLIPCLPLCRAAAPGKPSALASAAWFYLLWGGVVQHGPPWVYRGFAVPGARPLAC